MPRFTPAHLTLLAFSLTSTIILAGCSPATPTTTSPISVTIVSGQSAQNGELLQRIFDDYNAQAGSDIVDLQLSANSDLDTAQKVLVDIAAGDGPDAVRVTNATYQTLIDSGVAQSADSCLASDASVSSSLNHDLIDATVDGSIYQIPWYVTPNALFYNVDLFSKAGLDPDNPPRTMKEFHAAAKAIAATGASGGTAYFGNDYNFQTYLASLGGQAYDPSTGDLGIASPEGASVFETFSQMADDGSSPVYSNFFVEANEAFAGGTLGMIITAVSGYPALKATGNVNIRIAPVPAMDGGEQIAATSTNGFVITTTDPARQQAVCSALLSLLTPHAVTETVTATATIPLLTSTINDERYLGPVYAENPDWVAVRDQPTFAWTSLPGGVSAEYSDAYVDAQLKALRGDVSGTAAATELQATAEQLLKAK